MLPEPVFSVNTSDYSDHMHNVWGKLSDDDATLVATTLMLVRNELMARTATILRRPHPNTGVAFGSINPNYVATSRLHRGLSLGGMYSNVCRAIVELENAVEKTTEERFRVDNYHSPQGPKVVMDYSERSVLADEEDILL